MTAPQNPKNPDDQNNVVKRRSVSKLPAWNQTKVNQEFFSATLDHLIQPQRSEDIEGYIGEKPSYYNPNSDFYVREPSNLRRFYQLTTALVQTDAITGDVDKVLFYDDLINHLRFQGAPVGNHERLFTQEYYSWQPPIDLDKFMNFRNYYWLPYGGEPIELGTLRVTHEGNAVSNIFNSPDLQPIDSNLIEVQLDGQTLPVYDASQLQAAWYQIVSPTSIKVFPIPTQNSLVRITLFSPNQTDIADMVGELNYTVEKYPGYTRELSTGMRLKITNDIVGTNNGKVFIVEGIGRGIWLVEDEIYNTAWDTAAWDSLEWDFFIDVSKPDYLVMERGASNRNPWSENNRWFHRDVIENFFDPTLLKYQGQRPIVEFQKDMKMFNYGSIFRDPINLNVDSIPGILNILMAISETGTDYPGAGFEIGQSRHNKDIVWRHKIFDIEVWSTVDPTYDDPNPVGESWPSRSLGFSEVRVNGVQLFDGLRMLVTNDTNPAIGNHIYEINGIASTGSIIPVNATDGEDLYGNPVPGEIVFNKSDRKFYMFYTVWAPAQTKLTVNQAPLFDLFDINRNPLDNSGVYPKTNFKGSKVFSYAINEATGALYDTVLGLRLMYDEFGEILFENYIETDVTTYVNADNDIVEIEGFKFHRTDYADEPVFSNDWHKIPYNSPQKFTQKFTVAKNNNLFRLMMEPRDLPYSGSFVEVLLNNEPLVEGTQYVIQSNILRILPELIVNGDEILVTMVGDMVDQNETSYITEEFIYTDSNIFDLTVVPITPLTDETIKVSVNGVPIDLAYVSNDNLDPNQIVITYALNSGDVVDISVFVPIQPTSEYAFWNVPLNLTTNPNNEKITTISRSNFSEQFITNIERQLNFEGSPEAINNYRDTAKIKFLGDNILQHSSPMLKLMYMVADQNVDFVKSIRYVEREYTRFKNKFAQQLKMILDRGELTEEDTIADWLELTMSRLNVGKNSEFPFYNSGMAGDLTWIPPTPAYLGITGTYRPEILFDNTTGAPTKYIRGHDGSMLLAYSDIRDDVILELENQIYASIPTELKAGAPKAFDFLKVRPGRFRSTGYSYSEYTGVIAPIFERWAVSNSVNYRVNSTHDDFDPFTWNYSTSVDQQGQPLPGNWRGIYLYYFDTDRPHTHPWECLGFSEMPSWWTTLYGVAPYTRANTNLWGDIAAGVIREGTRAGTYPHLARSSDSISIWDVLPVGLTGELLNPMDAGIVRTVPSREAASDSWNPGDFGPVETVWYQSEQFGFAQAQAAYLMKPAEFIESTWDTKNRFVAYSGSERDGIEYDQVVDLTTNYRPSMDIMVHDELVDEVPLIRYGNQQFMVSYLEQNGLDITRVFGNPLRNTYVRLGHKMAGYISNSNKKATTDSFGVIPDEDVLVKLYESPSVREELYSGVIVEWTGISYRVYGYDVLDPRFRVIPSNNGGRRAKITIGSRQPDWEEWAPQHVYSLGELVLRENTFYRCKESHRSGNTFEDTYWALVEKPGTHAYLELTKKLDPVVGSPVIDVAYGTEYRTVQDVFDFLISYERYLESRGWVFDEFDDALQVQKDWTYSGKQFATWSVNQWDPGTFISLSPASKKVKYSSPHGLIKPLEQVINGVYSLLNRNGDRIETSKTIVSRFEETVQVAPEDPTNNLEGIYAARLYVTELEHIILFSNKTIFNDLIYDPLYGLRQPRLRISAVRTLDWNGRLDAPGFLVAGDELITNFEKSANDFRKYFDIEEQVDDPGLKNYANHLIAYQPRTYLNQLIISDKSQLNFYQGMIQQKGTPGALNKLLRSEFITQDSNLQMLEEWAFRLGSYGAYDAQPSMELRIPVRDYDTDPQLLEIQEVLFDDVPISDLLTWIKLFESTTGIVVPTNKSDWTTAMWDDWFNSFFKDDPNDKVITAYIVRDNSGRILAGDERWERRPDTSSRSYTEHVFPMIPYGTERNALPTAGYVHNQEYDHVFFKLSDMLAQGVYNIDQENNNTYRRYKDGQVVWFYDTSEFDTRIFTLDDQGANTIDYLGNDSFTGTTSFKPTWSTFRLIKQPWTVISSSPVQASDFVEIETAKPHGLKQGEIVIVYDTSTRSVFSNPTPVVVRGVTSQYKFRLPGTSVKGLRLANNSEVEFLKLLETRFKSLAKNEPTDYSLRNYMLSGSFDPIAAKARKDKLWVDNGVDVNSADLPTTKGWVTYQFDWFEGEDTATDTVFAKVPMSFNSNGFQVGWTINTGLDANTLALSKFVLGKATLQEKANGFYPLVQSVRIDEPVLPAYSMSYNTDTSILSIWLATEWRDFEGPVNPATNTPIYGSYLEFSNARSAPLRDFEGRFFDGISCLSAGFSTMEKKFRTAVIQDAAPLDGDYWIYVDEDGNLADDQIYQRVSGAWVPATYVIGDKFWDPNSLAMYEVTAVAPALALTPSVLVEGSFWFHKDSGIPYEIAMVSTKLRPLQITASEYYWWDSEPTSPSGIWKKLINTVWTTQTTPANGTIVYNLGNQQLYRKISTPGNWEVYTSLLPMDNRVLLSNTKECLVKTTNGFESVGLDANEFIFSGTQMWYWDGTSVTIAAYAADEYWIANDRPVKIDPGSSTGYGSVTLNIPEFWINKSLGLLFGYSVVSGRFTQEDLEDGEIWTNTNTQENLKYEAASESFAVVSLYDGDFYYDFTTNTMYLSNNQLLEAIDLTAYGNAWYNSGSLYMGPTGKLMPVGFTVGDYFYDRTSNNLFKFDGSTLVPTEGTELSVGYKFSSADQCVYLWDGAILTNADVGLYYSNTLYDWDGTLAVSVTVTFLTFEVINFVNLLGDQSLISLLPEGSIEFPVATQVENLEYTWSQLGPVITEKRRQLQKVDSHAVHNSLFYDSYNQQTDAYLYPYDPLKGIIPGVADREIWFKLSRDPAVYGSTSLVIEEQADTKDIWGKNQVGMTWWDLSKTRYLEYEMDNLEYRRNNWGMLAPLTTIDIYEWTRSLIPPDDYNKAVGLTQSQNEAGTRPAGTTYFDGTTSPYNTVSEYDDISNNLKTYYYFWVKNKSTLPNMNRKKYVRDLTAAQISSILTNPSQNGIVWANPIADNSLIFANATGLISGHDTVLQVNWRIDHNDGNVHRHFVLGREGDEDWIADDSLWEKMYDSLLGYIYYPKSTFVTEIQNEVLTLNESLGIQTDGLVNIDEREALAYRYGDGNNISLVHENEDISLRDSIVYEAVLRVPDPVLTESQRYGTQFRPRQAWFKNIPNARRNLVENFNYQLRQVWIDRDRFDWDMHMYQTEPEPGSHLYDRDVPDILSRDVFVQNNMPPAGFRILVHGNVQTDNFWTLWEIVSYSNANPIWELVTAQRYKLTDFWEKADYYDITIDPDNKPLRVFKDLAQFEAQTTGVNSIEFTDGELIQILNVTEPSAIDPTPYWEWRRYEISDGSWTTVAREKGTIRLKDSFYTNDIQIITKDHFYRVANPEPRADYTPYWDLVEWDSSAWDGSGFAFDNQSDGIDFSNIELFVQHMRSRDGSIELGLILDEIRQNQNFLSYLEQNRLFFSMINYVHAEQAVVDWAFKTSYIVITGYTEQLVQSKIIYPDIIGPLFDYINEVKPYHVKIRDFSRRVGYLDEAKICVTDFDKPVWQNEEGFYVVLDPLNEDDKAIICEETEDCIDNIFKPYGDASNLCVGGEPMFSPLIRNLAIEQRFDRVSCESSSSAFSPAWDIPQWDLYAWDPTIIPADTANDPYMFRIRADGKTIAWDLTETVTNRFFNVVTKSNNTTENLLYYVVPGYQLDERWSNIDRVSIKDMLLGTETILPEEQWSLIDTSPNTELPAYRLVLKAIPKENQIVEVVRRITEIERIRRMYKVMSTTKLGRTITDIIPSMPQISGCDFAGVILDGQPFTAGWDISDWDLNTGSIVLPARTAQQSNINTTRVVPETEPVTPAVGDLWFDTPSQVQLKYWGGFDWLDVEPIVGDLVISAETQVVRVWNGLAWIAFTDIEDGWDETSQGFVEVAVNDDGPKEWEFFLGDGIAEVFQMTIDNVDYGDLAYIVVYVDNQLVVMNGSDPFDYQWDPQTLEITFNSAPLNAVTVKVFKVYDYNGSGSITSTFLPAIANPTQDPWETLVEGGQFMQPWVGPNRPEELAFIRTHSPLVLDVFNNPAPGAPMLAKNKFKGNGSVGPYQIFQLVQSDDAIYVYENGLYMDPSRWTIDWLAQTITFTSPTIDGTQYMITSHSNGGDAIWDTHYFTSDGATVEFDLPNLPVLNYMWVTVNGDDFFDFTIDGPTITPEQAATGVPFNTADFTLTLNSPVTIGDQVTIVVYVNMVDTLLFSASIAQANSDEFIVTLPANLPVSDLGPYDNLSGNVTEFELSQPSEHAFPAWDKTLVYHNGLRICGPTTIYNNYDGINNCFDVPPISTPIDKDYYGVYVGGFIIPKEDWYITTKLTGLDNARLSAGGDNTYPNTTGWSFLTLPNYTWGNSQVHLEIFDTNNSWSGDITIFDKDLDQFISPQDFVDSMIDAIADVPYWEDAWVGLSFKVEDNAVIITHKGSMTVRITEVGNVPLVGAFFGQQNPEIEAPTAVSPYLLVSRVDGLPDLYAGSITDGVPPTVSNIPLGLGNVFDLNQTIYTDAFIEVTIDCDGDVNVYEVEIFDGISEINGVIVPDPMLSDNIIDVTDLYLSLKMFFAQHELTTGFIEVKTIGNDWDTTSGGWGASWWDLVNTITVCIPAKTTVTFKDMLNNPIVGPFFGTTNPTVIGEDVSGVNLPITSGLLTIRLNRLYVGVQINDLDFDGILTPNDVAASINADLEMQGLGVTASVIASQIHVTWNNFGYVQVLNADTNNLADVFFGMETCTTDTTFVSSPGSLPTCVRDTPKIQINVNHEVFFVDIYDITGAGEVTVDDLADIINADAGMISAGVTASVDAGKIVLTLNGFGYIEVADDIDEYYLHRVATYFFDSWRGSLGAIATSAPTNQICLGRLVEDEHVSLNVTYDWLTVPLGIEVGTEIVFGIFEDHAYEVDGTTLRIIATVAENDKIAAINFNTNDSMGIRTDQFIGSATGQYKLSQAVSEQDYAWVHLNGTRLVGGVHYTLSETSESWDSLEWDPADNLTGTRGWDIPIQSSTVKMNDGQVVSDDVCITSFSGEPRTSAVAMRLFRTDDGQWEHIRIADAHKTFLKSDLTVDATFLDVWETDKLPTYLMTNSPLMTPNSVHRLPGTIWVDGERINYWEIQGPFEEDDRRWWRLGPITRSTFKTTFGVEDIEAKAEYFADGTTDTFAIPVADWERVIVEICLNQITHTWDEVNTEDPTSTGWDMYPWDITLEPNNDIRQIQRDAQIEAQVDADTWVPNSSTWDWDYEIVGNNVVFKDPPVLRPNVNYPSIRITAIVRDYTSSDLSHLEDTLVIDGNINQRLPDNYTWKWSNVNPNRGLQRNKDLNTVFLLEKPGTHE